MIPQHSKNEVRLRIHKRIREKMTGTAERPRLNIYRSLNHVYVQLIDDTAGKTLLSASSNEGTGKKAGKSAVKSEGEKPAAGEKKSKTKSTGGNLASAKAVGKAIAERAKQKVSQLYDAIRNIVFASKKKNISTNMAATQVAEERMRLLREVHRTYVRRN